MFTYFNGVAEFISLMIFFLLFGTSVLLLKRVGLSGSGLAIIGYCVYHLIGGMIFTLVFVLLGASPGTWVEFIKIAVAYVSSWMLGLITPGLPAGLGVREVVLVGLLHESISDSAALATAVLLIRVINVLADVTYFVALQSWCLARFAKGIPG